MAGGPVAARRCGDVQGQSVGQAQPRAGPRLRPAWRPRLMVLGVGRPKLRKTRSYEGSRELAQKGSDRTRAELAQRLDLRPEVLYFLADDPDRKSTRLNSSH